MGLLVEGKWIDQWYDTKSTKGAYVRKDSSFRQWIKADGSSAFKPEKDRYHLYVSYACPWAHRTLIFRKLKKLEGVISISIVDPVMLGNGWEFHDSPGSIPDEINNKEFLYEIYKLADPQYSGRVTVPVLWDKKEKTIVNNESSEIIRMFNSEFCEYADDSLDYYPESPRNEIDEVNAFVYDNINNGVYKCGFATIQEAYEIAFNNLFNALDKIEERLKDSDYLAANTLTEADWRLFTTLVRFDAVYVGHFKRNLKRLADYKNISKYSKDLYNIPGVKETVNFDHIKRHYYISHRTINPTGIVPVGPELELD